MTKQMRIFLTAMALASTPATAWPQRVVNPDIPRVVLGFMIECSGCEVAGSGADMTYDYKTPPTIISVAQGGPGEVAGLKVGDVLTHIDGVSITTGAGARLLATAQDGKTLRLTVRRAGSAINLNLVPKKDTGYGRLRWYSFADSARTGWTFGTGASAFGAFRSDSTRFRFGRFQDSTFAWYRFADSASVWRIKGDTISFSPSTAQRGSYNSSFAGLQLSIEGATPVKVTVVEPDCALSLEVNGTRILLRAPGCKQQ